MRKYVDFDTLDTSYVLSYFFMNSRTFLSILQIFNARRLAPIPFVLHMVNGSEIDSYSRIGKFFLHSFHRRKL